MIRRVHGKYVLFAQDGSKVLGKHATKAEAEAQETAINISKARKAGHKIPKK
jgi:hypothetical protein